MNMSSNLELYALFKDGNLYKASYRQNVPYYETLEGAKKAIRSVTNRNSLPLDMYNNKNNEYAQQEIQDYLERQRERYTIHKFTLIDEGVVLDGKNKV